MKHLRPHVGTLGMDPLQRIGVKEALPHHGGRVAAIGIGEVLDNARIDV